MNKHLKTFVSYLYLITCLLLHRKFGYIAIVCKSGCDVMNFEVNLIFLIKSFFLYDQKVVTKT